LIRCNKFSFRSLRCKILLAEGTCEFRIPVFPVRPLACESYSQNMVKEQLSQTDPDPDLRPSERVGALASLRHSGCGSLGQRHEGLWIFSGNLGVSSPTSKFQQRFVNPRAACAPGVRPECGDSRCGCLYRFARTILTQIDTYLRSGKKQPAGFNFRHYGMVKIPKPACSHSCSPRFKTRSRSSGRIQRCFTRSSSALA